tara:strand:+ start:136 stop:324 length:189 start_codon:yes stop_codon:yes gene_type:complete
MTTMTMIHEVKSIELTEARESTSSAGPFWTRKLTVTDNQGNETQITLFAKSEKQLEIKETTT